MTPTPAALADVARHNGTPPDFEPEAPYVGLSFYAEADAALFFGRDGERQVIMGNLRASRLTLLYAQSGVGKSSLLRAGVAARLRELARQSLAGSGSAPQVPVVFSAWKDDPMQELIDEILAATNALLEERHSQLDLPRDSLRSAIEVATLALDQAVASDGSERAGSTLLIILDQFEEYFLYRAREGRVERFADELAECINQQGLRANFLISIREDAYSALGDLLRGRTNNVYGNYLHLDYLDAKAARAAIEKPLAYFNSLRPEAEQMTIEPGLVEAVLDQVERDPEEQALDGQAAGGGEPRRTEIATPYLQLVMTALWESERGQGSSVLRRSTLQKLRGAQSIVARHLGQALGELRPADRDLAIDVLHHLVTPSGSKVALEVADLSAYTGHPPERVLQVLGALAGPARILREVPPAPGKTGEGENARRFEIYHDVLARPINEAVSESATHRLQRQRDAAERRARQEQTRARRFRALAAAALVLLAAAVVAIVLAEVERNRARSAERTSRSRKFAFEAQAGFASGDLARGVLLSVQAYGTKPTPDARDALITALEATQGMEAFLTGQTQPITSVAFSPDGRTLASSSTDRTVMLSSTATARREALLSGHTDQVTSVSFSPDGATLASSDASGDVILWNARTHARRRTLGGIDGAIETVTFAPTGRLLATAQADGTATLWDPVSGQRLHTLPVSAKAVVGLAFSPDGTELITGGQDGTVTFWNTVSGRPLHTLHETSVVNSVAFNPRGTLLAVGSGSNVVLYNLRTLRVERALSGNAGDIDSVVFSSDGRILAAGAAASTSATGTGVVWDVASGRLLNTMSEPNAIADMYSVALSPDGRTLASGGDTPGNDASLIFWHTFPATGLRVLSGGTAPVRSVAFNPTGGELAATGTDGNVVIWSLRTGTTTNRALGQVGETVAFSPDGRMLAAGGDGRTIVLSDVASGRQLRVLRGHQNAVFSIAFSPNGKLLASGSADQRVIVWDVNTGTPVRVLTAHAQVNAVAFSHDGTRLASGGNDDLINVWDLATGRRELTLTATRPVAAVAFSRDDQRLASAGADEVVSIWNLSKGQLAGAPLAGHEDTITGLAFSGDRRYLVSGSNDRNALVWNLKTGLAVPIGGHTDAITSVAFSPDSRLVASGSSDGTVVLSPVPTGLNAKTISQRLCNIVRRNLSRAEWRQFVPDEPYQRTCQP